MSSTPLPRRGRAAATSRVGDPTAPTDGSLCSLPPNAVVLTGGLWHELQQRNADAVIPHALAWMERTGWLSNFDAIAGNVRKTHSGVEFVDSEVYKLLEALAWELGRRDDAELTRAYDGIVNRVAAAQDDDGYLHTSFGHTAPDGTPQRPRYSDMEWGHELYCHGHLLQAAAARLRTGHDDELVAVARRLVDHLVHEFGPHARNAICGHPEIELALVEFGRCAHDRRCIDLARLFIERRGHRTLRTTVFQGAEYFQDDVPVRDARVLRGHAVRAMYLSAGAIDVAVETDDAELVHAVREQYDRTIGRRSYITGGVGAHHQNEEIGDDFELPADRAYAETCAAIGSVMVAWRLLLQTGDVRYADQIERTLLNAVLVSARADGRAFFYSNTLHQRRTGVELPQDELSESAEASMRAPWFEVSCCPSNLARTLASVSTSFATTDSTGVQLHQYGTYTVHTQVDGEPLTLRVESDYPFDGDIHVVVDAAPAHPVSVQMRIPRWAEGTAGVRVNGLPGDVSGRTHRVVRRFHAGDTIDLQLPMRPRIVHPHPRVDAVRGQVAFERGPLVLALEDVDLPADVDVEHIDLIEADGVREQDGRAFVRLRERAADESPQNEAFDAALLPYKDWGNRGPSTMRVWIPTV